MALLAIIRRLQVHRQRPLLCLSQSSHSPADHFISSSLRLTTLYLSQSFHQTPYRSGKLTPHLRSLTHADAQNPYQIIDFSKYLDETDEDTNLGVREILERVENVKDIASGDEAIAFLDSSGVKPDENLIFSVIWGLKDEWKLAFLVFKWGERLDCVFEKTLCLMIWLLGNHKKFSTAWTLIHELYHDSKDSHQAMMIMIDRYAAANYPDKAIKTFHLMQTFKFSPEPNTYFAFLNILCKHENIEEAEEFMFLNKKFFPLSTESFNTILNGWCNIVKDIYEAKRVWREMSKCCVEPNGASYTHMISCYSSVGNLFDSLRLYDEMKKRGWVPGVEVYHSLIYVMTRENCLSEALKIIDRMKETGLNPNSTTYNLIIDPLCERSKFEEARTVLARMIGDEIKPTIDTYHALLKGESLEGILGVLDYMRKDGLGPLKDTFVIIIDKLLKIGDPENALRMWSEMKEYEIKPECLHYSVLVEGLVKYGLIEKARELYCEMRRVLVVDDPFLNKLVYEKEVRSEKGYAEMTVVRNIKKGKGLRCTRFNVVQSRKHRKRCENKRRES